MSTEIVVFAVYIDGILIDFYDTKEDAEHHIAHAHHGGTVVRLSGKMPKVARKREFTAYVSDYIFGDHSNPDTTYMVTLHAHRDWKCRAKITVEELTEEAD